MKKTLLTLLIAIVCLSVNAQDSLLNQKEVAQYLFSDFTPGIVKKKNGEMVNTSLNYNTITQEMIFENNNKRLALYQLEEIDSIWVGGKVFVPAGKIFYEKATATPIALYIQHRTGILPPEKSIGYGNTIAVGAITNVSNFGKSNSYYRLTMPENYKTTDRTLYWLWANDKYVEVTNAKSLQSVFPARRAAIKSFIKANNINLNKADDMIKLIEFCNS
jgi:hypothetical protein